MADSTERADENAGGFLSIVPWIRGLATRARRSGSEPGGTTPEPPTVPRVGFGDISPDGERCRVCAEDFQVRARARCPGCVRRIHRDGCSNYMTVAYSYQVGMCNACCDKVSGWFDEVRGFVKATKLVVARGKRGQTNVTKIYLK